MTGATSFTRKAGLAGLLSFAVGVAGLVLLRPWEWSSHSARPYLSDDTRALRTATTAVMLLCFLALVTGLAVRHRDYPLVRAAKWFLPVGVALGVVTGDVTAVTGSLGVAMLLVLLAVAIADELPRTAAVLVLVAPVFEGVLDLLGLVVGSAGWVWLAWALWREPLAAELPEEEDTPLAAAASRRADVGSRS